ncbi:MAG: polysaccharide biosynthesis tyrosine autokinase [Ktedonobacteraceae bacterium]
MQNPLSHYMMLAKRWAWLMILGIVICGGATYAVSKFIHPTYQASTTLILTVGTGPSAYDTTTATLEALPTYAALITTPTVLNPVLEQHPGLTNQQLQGMVSVKPQSNTQLIELDVENTNPVLAAQLANEISQSFAQYGNTQLSGTVKVLPAQTPINPIKPKPSLDAAIGALVGLGLAIALIIIFEWLDGRLTNPDEVEEKLGLETLTIIPHLSRNERNKSIEEIPALAERCRTLSSSLNALKITRPFKLLMVTSALPGEGKSTVAANLAYFLAITGKRVLLVDANLRQPSLDQHFQLANRPGLADALLETWAQLDINLDGQPTEIPTLFVLTGGAIPANAADMLSSSIAKRLFKNLAEAPYDFVIFDTPPVLPVADAQILAGLIEATILIVDASKTSLKSLVRAKKILSRTSTDILGVVLNKSPWPDYGDIRHYMSEVRQPKESLFTAMQAELPPGDRTNGSIDRSEENAITASIHNHNQVKED